jgi:hypothetical protein
VSFVLKLLVWLCFAWLAVVLCAVAVILECWLLDRRMKRRTMEAIRREWTEDAVERAHLQLWERELRKAEAS